eukprot:CAMPEP_0119285348 /NCGR_PEP_ID=MMETSP1329-20130426/32022_1 /TAXON_ID=114041 /ORGANISM="Genus nov. species nov., Strain RCC1024" /LENGTH=180 /DNA_ID=CAMNT_0007286059 /DNA_START=98 /DNA_END=637 /DNA_ORIENTATION=+
MARWPAFLIALAAAASAGQAPAEDKAANYPVGWCDTNWGTPTRTTGECMCKQACDGPKCERAQGFVWYAYEKCPSCKCVQGSEEPYEAPPEDDDEITELPTEPEPEPEETLGEKIFDFFDENGDAIFGILFTVVSLGIMIPALFMTFGKAGAAATPKAAATTAAKAPAPAPAADSDSSDD